MVVVPEAVYLVCHLLCYLEGVGLTFVEGSRETQQQAPFAQCISRYPVVDLRTGNFELIDSGITGCCPDLIINYAIGPCLYCPTDGRTSALLVEKFEVGLH